MRTDIERSLARTLADRNPAMKQAGITPLTAFDTEAETHGAFQLREPPLHDGLVDERLGRCGLDAGHFAHRKLAGQQIMGMNTDGNSPRTSNFMEHGTLAGRIRQEDYRPFLLSLVRQPLLRHGFWKPLLA